MSSPRPVSDFSNLQPPSSAGGGGAHHVQRSSSPAAGNPPGSANAGRFSLKAGSTPPEQVLRLQQQAGKDNGPRSPGLPSPGLGPGTPGGTRGIRPSSEQLLNIAHAVSPESDAIDKWFEDLQHYEQTLEEMAAASLDQNFKEELSAIEQWFRVLSEAERTAALYSLLQESTQVQIRFFITVLQQMARSDPMTALLSPNNPQQSSMAEQMEHKLAQMGLKSPGIKGPSSPGGRSLARQSVGDPQGFLSPNSAMFSPSANADASTLAAQQRARMKANRISAPGQLPGDATRSPLWNQTSATLDQVIERGPPSPSSPRPHSPAIDQGAGNNAARPKSTDLTNLSSPQFAGRSPRVGGGLDELSPLVSGANWASMVNTPLVPMFAEKNKAEDEQSANNLDAAAAKLANWSMSNQQPGSKVVLDDARKFRRSSRPNSDRLSAAGSAASANVQGVLTGMYDDKGNLQAPSAQRKGADGGRRSPGPAANSHFAAQQTGYLASPTASDVSSMAGLSSYGPAGMANFAAAGGMGGLAGLNAMNNLGNLQMMNAMAAMGGLGNMNMSAANLVALQQQAAMSMFGAPPSAGGRSGRSGYGGLSPGLPSSGGRRSPLPHNRGGTSPGGKAGGGGGEEEVADMNTLNDVPAWLRTLRLHKYTPNFEGSNWREMVLMDDGALEKKGVAALGARRKMLKTFEAVREKYGIEMPGQEGKKESGAAASADGAEKKEAVASATAAAEGEKEEASAAANGN